MLRGVPSWHTSSTSPMSMPSSSEAVATITLSLPALRRCSASKRVSFERLPWWAATFCFAEPLGEVARHALDHAARVGEHQRGVMFFDEPGELVVHRGPHLARHHRLERRGRHHQVDVAFADVAAVDDRWCRAGKPGQSIRSASQRMADSSCGLPELRHLLTVPISDQQPRDFLDGLLRRGQADALDGLRGVRVHARQRERQVRAALGLRDGVDFVDDHRAHRREHLAARGAGQQ